MKMYIEIILFIVAGLFLNASQVVYWFLGAGKPEAPSWKTYLIIAIVLYAVLMIYAYD